MFIRLKIFWHWHFPQNPASPKITKSSISFDIIRQSNSCLSVNTIAIHSNWISNESCTLVGEDLTKNISLWLLHKTFDSPNSAKKVICILTHLENQTQILSVHITLIPFNNFLDESSKHVKEHSTEKPLLLFCGSELRKSEDFEKTIIRWFISTFSLKYLTNYFFDFFPQGLIWKFDLSRKHLPPKINFFRDLLWVSDSLKSFPFALMLLNFLDFQIIFFSIFRALIPPVNISIDDFLLPEKFFLSKLSILFFASES